MEVCIKGDLDGILQLLEASLEYGPYAISEACTRGHTHVVNVLIHRAELSGAWFHGLRLACMCNRLEIITIIAQTFTQTIGALGDFLDSCKFQDFDTFKHLFGYLQFNGVTTAALYHNCLYGLTKSAHISCIRHFIDISALAHMHKPNWLEMLYVAIHASRIDVILFILSQSPKILIESQMWHISAKSPQILSILFQYDKTHFKPITIDNLMDILQVISLSSVIEQLNNVPADVRQVIIAIEGTQLTRMNTMCDILQMLPKVLIAIIVEYDNYTD